MRRFWLYALFEHQPGMAHPAMPSHGRQAYDQIVQKFATHPQVAIRRGLIPDVFAQGAAKRIACAADRAGHRH